MSRDHDRDPPATWEKIAGKEALDKYPSIGGLERWETEALKLYDHEKRHAKKPLELDDVVRLLAPSMPSHVSDVERELIAGLALSLWGSEHIDAAKSAMAKRKRRHEGGPPFGSFVEVLGSALRMDVEMGRGSVAPATIDPTIQQYAVQWPNPARVGIDYMPAKQSRSGGSPDPRGLATVDRHVDAFRGVVSSLLGPTEIWMLRLVYLGEETKWAPKLGGKLGKVEKRKRSYVADAYRSRLCLDAGRYPSASPCPARDRKAKPDTKHAETCPAHGVSDRAVTERISAARERLVTALVDRGLIPEPKSRQEAAERKRKAKHKPRVAPVRPSYYGGA